MVDVRHPGAAPGSVPDMDLVIAPDLGLVSAGDLRIVLLPDLPASPSTVPATCDPSVAPVAVEAFREGPVRRWVDVVIALVALVLLAPVLGVIAAAVSLETPGPVLFRQVRVGRGRQPFRILKFRSMVVTAPSAGPCVSGRRDPRVTAVGRVLRATALDELPQLVNVLIGEMTLIGPRAEVPRYVEHYTAAEGALLDVRPGLTGAGQVHFARQQSSELDDVVDPERHYLDHQLHAKLALDLDYLRHRSLMTDVRVVTDTLRHLLRH